MRTIGLVICAVLLFSLTLVLSSRQSMFAQAPTLESDREKDKLNTVSLNFTAAQLDPLEGNAVIRAFVATGSKSVNCLATLNEIRTNVVPTGITMFCGEREPFAFGDVPGVLVSVFFTQPASPDLVLSVSLAN